jgi:hypothetical protein
VSTTSSTRPERRCGATTGVSTCRRSVERLPGRAPARRVLHRNACVLLYTRARPRPRVGSRRFHPPPVTDDTGAGRTCLCRNGADFRAGDLSPLVSEPRARLRSAPPDRARCRDALRARRRNDGASAVEVVSPPSLRSASTSSRSGSPPTSPSPGRAVAVVLITIQAVTATQLRLALGARLLVVFAPSSWRPMSKSSRS